MWTIEIRPHTLAIPIYYSEQDKVKRYQEIMLTVLCPEYNNSPVIVKINA